MSDTVPFSQPELIDLVDSGDESEELEVNVPHSSGKRELEEKDEDDEPPKKKGSKRICSAVKICGTAAQCEWTIEELRDALLAKFGSEIRYSIVRETHADGGHHFHFYVQRRQKMQVYSNVLKSEGRSKPCDFKTCWDEQGWQRYMNKEEGAVHLSNCDGGLLGAKNERELFERARVVKGDYAAMKDYSQLVNTWEFFNKKKQVFDPKYERGSFKTFYWDCLGDWFEKAFSKRDSTSRFPILVVYGPTQNGKTQLVRHFLHAMGKNAGYCKGHQRPRAWMEEIDCMVLDDIADKEEGGCDHMPNKAWTATDSVVIKGKYMARAQVTSVPVVLIMNTKPLWLDDAYWSRNSDSLAINERVFI